MIRFYKKVLIICFLMFFAVAGICYSMEGRENEVSDNYKLEVKLDKVLVRGIPFNIKVKTVDDTGKPANVTEKLHLNVENHQLFQINEGKETLLNDEILIKNGKAEIKNLIIKNIGKMNFVFTTTTAHANVKTRILPGLLTLLPPLLAIILALTLKQVVVALLCGIWLGAIFMYDFNPLISFMRVLDTLIVGAISDPGHVSIITFDFFLGGMVALIYRSGGSMGLVKSIKKWAKTPRTGQLATWAMGLFIFFDDYANTLIVGNSMRPLTDKLKISREKLSFIVDATAAPVANVAIISTWIGFELSVIGDSLKNVGLNNEPYMVFVQSIPYRFYPVLMIIFIFLVSYMMKDFGPMLKAEIRARKTGEVLGKNAKPISNIDSAAPEMENVPERWYNAVIPIATVILATIGGLIYTGFQGFIQKNGTEAIAGVKIYQILNNANSFQSLLWASFLGTAVVIILALSQKIMNLEEAVNTWIDGAKAIIPAVIILCLAWTIGDICKILKTGPFLATMAEGNIMPQLLPVIIFVISAVIAFATGTSWGTMSIIMPIAVFVGFHLPPQTMAAALKESILLSSISGVLAGATFGDHCSPISDTTIMSSMASASDHIDHVRTQMPYAVLVGLVSISIGILPAGFGVNPWISIFFSVIALYLILNYFGKNPEEQLQIMKSSGGSDNEGSNEKTV